MAQAGIVISCRGTARSARVRMSQCFGIASGLSSHFGGSSSGCKLIRNNETTHAEPSLGGDVLHII
jgi:hypothetical protein